MCLGGEDKDTITNQQGVSTHSNLVLQAHRMHSRLNLAPNNTAHLIINSLYVGHIHIVGRGANILKLLIGENVNTNHVHLHKKIGLKLHQQVEFCSNSEQWNAYFSMTVLASLGSGHLNDFARTTLQDHEAVFAQGAALLWVGHRGPSISTSEIKIWICHGGV